MTRLSDSIAADGNKLEAPDRNGLLMIGHGIGRVAHQGGSHLPRPSHHLIDLLHPAAQSGGDLLGLLACDGLVLHELVDIQPVALGRRDTPGGGVGLLQIAHLLQVRQLVAHGGGADLAGHPLHNGLGADGLGRLDVALGDDLQYLLFSICHFHSFLRF